jgi:peptidoglycan/xylan/chitin deacetylase (PgdA/CDA1 family)
VSDERTVILMYHEIVAAGRAALRPERGYTRYVVSEYEFRRQLDRIEAANLAGTGIGAALAGNCAVRPSVVITFDDGCATDIKVAAPLLQSRGFGATFYVIAGFVGRPGFLTGSEVRQLDEAGFEIGCHSMTHPYLTDLTDAQLRVELWDSRRRLEDLIGGPVPHFSCPGGRWNGRVDRLARAAGYESVATSRPGVLTPTTDRFCLPRVGILRGTAATVFDRVCRGRGLWRRRVKGAVLAAAKRLTGNAVYERLRAAMLGCGSDRIPPENVKIFPGPLAGRFDLP